MLDQIESEARRNGIGLIVAADPLNYEDWDRVVDAARQQPDPEKLNEFIASQFDQNLRDRIIRWIK